MEGYTEHTLYQVPLDYAVYIHLLIVIDEVLFTKSVRPTLTSTLEDSKLVSKFMGVIKKKIEDQFIQQLDENAHI